MCVAHWGFLLSAKRNKQNTPPKKNKKQKNNNKKTQKEKTQKTTTQQQPTNQPTKNRKQNRKQNHNNHHNNNNKTGQITRQTDFFRLLRLSGLTKGRQDRSASKHHSIGHFSGQEHCESPLRELHNWANRESRQRGTCSSCIIPLGDLGVLFFFSFFLFLF